VKRDSLSIRSSVWIYTKLLALYPVPFQMHYGREMTLTFRDICRLEKNEYGLNGVISLWFEVIIDLAATILEEHLKEVRMLSQNQSFVRIAGVLGAIGGVLAIIVGFVLLSEPPREDVTTIQMVLFVMTFLLTAIGTIGLFLAGRHEREVNVGLGIMLFGALLGTIGPLLMIAEIGVGWIIFPIGFLFQGAGLVQLSLVMRHNPGFIRMVWLPLTLGLALVALTITGMATDSNVLWGLLIMIFGVGWGLLGLLLLSGNVRTDAPPPATV
jgi:hypothetical protein